MTTFSRRGACPALSAPMLTGDGLLVRLNPVAGEISPTALIGLCQSALRHGNGIVEVTARGSIQIRGLTTDSAALLAAEVDALGIAVRTGVPVDTSPLAGIDPTEVADPSPLAEAIRAAISEANLAPRLGPKVSVVVDGRGQIDLVAIIGDVRLVAIDGSCWHLSVAGDQVNATPVAVLTHHAGIKATLGILSLIADLGRSARARDLPVEEIRRVAGPADDSISEPPRVTDSSAIGILPLADSCRALGVGLPFGQVRAEALIDFCEAAMELGATGIRPAPARTILVMSLSQAACEALRDKAKALGLVTDLADPRTRIAACPGAPACASGMIAARDVAAEIARDLGQNLDPTLSLHISGCAKGCAHPGTAALTIVGDEKGAAFVVGGTAKGLPAAYTAGYEAARGVSRLAAMIAAERLPQEDAAACLTRLGAVRLVRTIA